MIYLAIFKRSIYQFEGTRYYRYTYSSFSFFYKLFMLIRETRAEQLTKGIFALFVFTKLSEWLELYTINWLLKQVMTVGTLAILIVFQPELRRALEYIGRSRFFY